MSTKESGKRVCGVHSPGGEVDENKGALQRYKNNYDGTKTKRKKKNGTVKSKLTVLIVRSRSRDRRIRKRKFGKGPLKFLENHS